MSTGHRIPLTEEEKAAKREYNRAYRATPRGAAGFAWNRLTSRAGAQYNHRQCYTDVEVRISRADFIAWAVPEYERWFRECPGVTPSVDRIDSTGHYEAGNLRLIARGENCRRTRVAHNPDAPEGTLWCCTCRTFKPREDFYAVAVSEKNPYGYTGHCKPCSIGKATEATRRKRLDPEFRERERLATNERRRRQREALKSARETLPDSQT